MTFYEVLVYFVVINHIRGENEPVDLKNLIKEAGCPFYNKKQLLINNVCLMPDYQKNEHPENSNGIVLVDTDWFQAPQVLDVDEKKNRITFQLQQYMEWSDPRIKVNMSAMKSLQNSKSWIKFPPLIENRIWHPDLDLHTEDLQEWKSLYTPYLFQSVGINRCPLLRKCDLMANLTFFADKRWKIDLFCMFNFSSFPFDTQLCKFRQRFESTSATAKIFLYPPCLSSWQTHGTKIKRIWQYTIDGFKTLISPIGDAVLPSSETQEHTGGEYGFDVELQRLVQPYIFQYYIPSAAIVVVSHISFIIPITSIPGRVGLVATQFLTLTNIFIHQMVSTEYD